MPSIDGADAQGNYAAGVVVSGPVCTSHYAEIELPPPDPCDVDVPAVPAVDVQNYALGDGSCAVPPNCGGALPPCSAIGDLVLAAP